MNRLVKSTFIKAMTNGLLKRKSLYVVSKKLLNEDEVILQTFSKKEAYLKSDFEAKNKTNPSKFVITLTHFKMVDKDTCQVCTRYINEKTLNKTINSKKFNNLKS